MFSYYLGLGLRSLRRNPALTALMVLTLAVGVAASISTLTILHAMSRDPIPQKSERLFLPVFDLAPPEGYTPENPDPVDSQMSYRDVTNLLASGIGARRTAVWGVGATIEPGRRDLPVQYKVGIAANRSFFPMLDAPFLYGQPWSEADDKAGADVVVLRQTLAENLFGKGDPVGKRVRMMNRDFTVVGVLRPFRPLPKFYRTNSGLGPFGEEDDFYLPFASAIEHQASHNGGIRCTRRPTPGWQGLLASECTWLRFMFEMPSGAERAALQAYLDNYANEQRRLGRMQRGAPNQLYDVREWLDLHNVVGNDNRLAAVLAFAFLLLCLVNTVGLLLAKLAARAPEVGVRRALGATRADIFKQYLTESAVVGLAGGMLGLLLSFGALALIALQSNEIDTVARMDWQMLLATFAMAICAALVAGLIPTWRACQVTPAIQLKSQ
jgi:putative ABC transport system permease protein